MSRMVCKAGREIAFLRFPLGSAPPASPIPTPPTRVSTSVRALAGAGDCFALSISTHRKMVVLVKTKMERGLVLGLGPPFRDHVRGFVIVGMVSTQGKNTRDVCTVEEHRLLDQPPRALRGVWPQRAASRRRCPLRGSSTLRDSDNDLKRFLRQLVVTCRRLFAMVRITQSARGQTQRPIGST